MPSQRLFCQVAVAALTSMRYCRMTLRSRHPGSSTRRTHTFGASLEWMRAIRPTATQLRLRRPAPRPLPAPDRRLAQSRAAPINPSPVQTPSDG